MSLTTASLDSFKCKTTLTVGGKTYKQQAVMLN